MESQNDWDQQRAKEQAELAQHGGLAGQAATAGYAQANLIPTAACLLERIEFRRDQLLKELATLELAAENLKIHPELAQLYEAMIQVQSQL